jgi:hypothetical protein
MRKECKYDIKIRFLPGSESQGELMDMYMEVVLKSLAMYFKSSHKKNKVYIDARKKDKKIYWFDDEEGGYTL